MLNFYDKITCYPPHKILSEFEEILLLTRNNFYDKIVIINENDKINDDWINNDIEVIISEEQNTLLLESAKLSGVKNLISVIQNANFNDKLSFDDISFYLEGNKKLSKYLKSCTKRYPIIIFPINFSNPTQINWIKKEYNFNTEFERGNLSLKEYQEREINLFKEKLKDSSGAIIFNNGIAFMFLNTQHGIVKQTVIHELHHYFQEIFDIDTVTLNDEKFKDIPELNLSKEDIAYLLSKYEFLPHISDLAANLSKIYFKYFKHITHEKFLNQFISLIEESGYKFLNTNFAKIYLKEIKSDVSDLVILSACKILKEEHLYKIGIESLKNEFIHKIYFYKQEKG